MEMQHNNPGAPAANCGVAPQENAQKPGHAKPCWNWRSELLTLATILVMVTVQCAAINGLYKPNGLISGGFTGVSMLI